MDKTKKNLLFVMNSLNCGGAEKALISLLQSLDYSKYEVDLFLFKQEGLFLSQLPLEINLLPSQGVYNFFDMSIKKAIVENIISGDFKIIVNRIRAGILFKTEKNKVIAEQKLWQYLGNSLDKIDKKYDLAIGFMEKTPIYFCVDKVNATKKIGWIHTDLEALNISFQLENSYFEKLDFIVTVSSGLSDRLKAKLPNFSNKIVTIENIISKDLTENLSNKSYDSIFNSNYFNIIFVGRLEPVKGLETALEAIHILINKNIKVRFYLVGDGSQKSSLHFLAKNLNIENNVYFLGSKSNPYPYVKDADIFLLTSFYEGKSIALEEAKILQKPIIVTNFTSATDQIENNKTGLIVEMNPESIAAAIEKLVTNETLRKSLIANLQNSKLGNENEVQKLYELIN